MPTGETLELIAQCFLDSGRLEVVSGLGMFGQYAMLLMFFKQRTIWLGDKHLGLLSRRTNRNLLWSRDAVVVEDFSYLAPAAITVRTPTGEHRFSFMGPWLQHAKELSDRLQRASDTRD